MKDDPLEGIDIVSVVKEWIILLIFFAIFYVFHEMNSLHLNILNIRLDHIEQKLLSLKQLRSTS